MSEFKITGLGIYKNRKGHEVRIVKTDKSGRYSFLLSSNFWYTESGHLYFGQINDEDLIEGPLECPQEMAGLTGFVAVDSVVKSDLNVCGAHSPEAAFQSDMHTVIDLSKIPASAIVKQQPKAETRRVWLVMWPDKSADVFKNREEAKNWFKGLAKPIAIVETEITFKEGDGL